MYESFVNEATELADFISPYRNFLLLKYGPFTDSYSTFSSFRTT